MTNMEFNTNKKDLERVLKSINICVDQKAYNPVLACTKIAIVENIITFTGQNQGTEISDSIICDTKAEGVVVVNAKSLLDVVLRTLENTIINVKTRKLKEDVIVVITSGSRTFEVEVVNDDYPMSSRSLDPSLLDYAVKIDTRILYKLINKVDFCADKDVKRGNLNGVYFEKRKDEETKKVFLESVATNAHSLAYCKTEVEDNGNFFEGIVPLKTILEIKKLLGVAKSGAKNTCELSIIRGRIVLKIGRALCYESKLIDAKFPNYKRIIPTNHNKKMKISTTKFLKELEVMDALSDINGITLKTAPTAIQLYTNGKKKNITNTDCIFEGAETFDYRINPTNLFQVIKNMKEDDPDEIQITFFNSKSPMWIKNPSDPSYYYLASPLK